MLQALIVVLLLVASPAWAQFSHAPPSNCASGTQTPWWNGTAWSCNTITAIGGGLPAGALVMVLTPPCPVGFVEEASLAGKFVLGTTTAAADAGQTGGADTITQVITHTHPVTDPGHAHNQQRHSATTGALTGIVTAPDTSSATVAAMGPNTASATTGVTTSAPAGAVASIDNRPAFVKVIWCKKT